MNYSFWIFQVVILGLTSGAVATELLPERYLRPQDFNHHPFTDVGIPASLKKASVRPTNLYAILSKKRPREGREFPPQNVVIYPTPHPSVTARKDLETNEVDKYDDPYAKVPKNYAFSYIVKDHYSGDDFSHSQAHNGKATRGQYRVKLPDGRTQIVNYTADHKGYRADVQYEEDSPNTHRHGSFHPQHIPLKPLFSPTPSPHPHILSSTAAFPVQYVAANAPLKLQLKPTASPLQYQPQYVSTTAAPYVQQQVVTSTAAPHYVPQQTVSPVPLYPSAAAAAAAVPYHGGQYQTYQAIASSVAPEHAVIVTPRPTYNHGIRKSEPQQSAPLYYRLL